MIVSNSLDDSVEVPSVDDVASQSFDSLFLNLKAGKVALLISASDYSHRQQALNVDSV